MAYSLTPELITGNAMIDAEHKQLIDAINGLLDACSEGKGRKKISETMKFLQSYTKKHFGDEERLQLSSGYPDYVNHKGYHAFFIKKVDELSAKLNKEGPSVAIVAEINKTLADWLFTHIKTQDVKVAAHIRSKEGK